MSKGYKVNREGRTVVFQTFWQWLQNQNQRNDSIGDLSRDAIEDPHSKGNSLEWWIEHLQDHHYACDDAFEALRNAWDEWENVDYS